MNLTILHKFCVHVYLAVQARIPSLPFSHRNHLFFLTMKHMRLVFHCLFFQSLVCDQYLLSRMKLQRALPMQRALRQVGRESYQY